MPVINILGHPIHKLVLIHIQRQLGCPDVKLHADVHVIHDRVELVLLLHLQAHHKLGALECKEEVKCNF